MAGEVKPCYGCMEFYPEELDICPHCGCPENIKTRELWHIDPGTILNERYIIGHSLGYGGFGVTYIGWDTRLKRKVAIKEYLPSEFATRVIHEQDLRIANNEKKQKQFDDGMQRFIREGKRLAQVDNIDGIVHLYDSFEANNTAYIIMEYLEGETLKDYMQRTGKLTEQQALDIMIPILYSLDAVHEKGIIHRDIAPDNIFMARGQNGELKVKLIDFGAAKFATTSHSKSLTVLIKPGYSPEEQYRSDGEQGPYTDVYALAAVMYELVTGVRPTDSFERRTALETKKKDPLELPSKYNKELSDNFEIALLNALNVKTEDRTATVGEFASELVSFEPVKRRGTSLKKIDFFRWPLWAKIAVPTSGVLAAVLLVLLSMEVIQYVSTLQTQYTLPEGMTRVPELIGVNLETARAWAEEDLLVLEEAGREYVPDMDADLVIRQETASGSIQMANTVIPVVISSMEEKYTMPDVTGYSYEVAKQALECLGLEVLENQSYGAGLVHGSVITQDIDPYSEVKSGQTVTLTVADDTQNPEKVSSEHNNLDFVGMKYEEALELAQQNGVRLQVVEKIFTKEHEEDIILSQSQNDGFVGITITLKSRSFVMPDLRYKSQDTAVQILKNLGIEAAVSQENSETVASGLVQSQSVERDSAIESGSNVELVVSKGSKPFEMPNVWGMKEADARNVLLELGLVVEIEYGYDENCEPGTVVIQSIGEDAEVIRGTTVSLVICSLDGIVRVEDVSGKTKNEAISILEGQGFKVTTSEAYSRSVDSGKVISQLPAAGTNQVKGVEIALTISKGPEPVVEDKEETEPETENNQGNNNVPSTWSGWVTSLPAGVSTSNYSVQTKKQYRYRTREVKTTSEKNLAGWNLIDEVYAWGDYGDWTSWQTEEVKGDDRTKVESKYQYRYRDLEKTTSTSGDLSGWTQVNSSAAWTDYGEWTGWSDSSVNASNARQVEDRTVWGYYYFQCPNCGAHMHVYGYTCFTWAGGCGLATVPESSWHQLYSTTSWDDAGLSDFHGTGKYVTTINGERYFKWPEGGFKKQYRYRDRAWVTTYEYERWGEWSSWSDNAADGSSTRDFEMRTVYRYCTRPQIYSYKYERWSDWSAYSDNIVSGDANLEVQTRTLYRYKAK